MGGDPERKGVHRIQDVIDEANDLLGDPPNQNDSFVLEEDFLINTFSKTPAGDIREEAQQLQEKFNRWKNDAVHEFHNRNDREVFIQSVTLESLAHVADERFEHFSRELGRAELNSKMAILLKSQADYWSKIQQITQEAFKQSS